MKNRANATIFIANKDELDAEIYDAYKDLLLTPLPKQEAKQVICQRYKIQSYSTIWAICRRVEKRRGIRGINSLTNNRSH